jgi:predicted MFS family arabinose efflux permease
MTQPQGMPAGLLPVLALANFAIGMGAFVAVGILSPVAQGFGLTPSQAGWVMTVYALVYALSSPLLVALTGGFDRKAVLLAGLALFGIGAAAAAAAPSFAALLGARGVMALGGGLVTPVAAAVVAGLTAPAARGRALATVFGGLTLAQVLGVPAGAWLDARFGWPVAFLAVAGLCAAVLAALLLRVPTGIAVPRAGLAALGQVLRSGWRMGAVGFTVLFMGGVWCVYAFFDPLIEARLGLGRDGVSAMLVIFGLGAVAGNWLGGRLTDRVGSNRTLLILCAAQAVLLPVVAGVALPVPLTAVLIGGWSVCGWSFMAAQQARLAGMDPARTAVLLALNAAAIYIAAALGTFGGGLVLDRTGSFAGLGVLGAVAVLAAAWSIFAVARAVVQGQFVSKS